jgi:prepilin-type N-terminal cleavage/methylation domain-containing protein
MSLQYNQQQVFLDMKLSRKGFTLIELIIFIVVGAIILPASFVAFTAAIKHFSTPDYYVKARFFAEERMENITSNAYAAGIAVPSGVIPDIAPETGFQRTWSVCYVPPGNIDYANCDIAADTNYKKVTVTVTPPSGPDYIVKTIVTKRPKL